MYLYIAYPCIRKYIFLNIHDKKCYIWIILEFMYLYSQERLHYIPYRCCMYMNMYIYGLILLCLDKWNFFNEKKKIHIVNRNNIEPKKVCILNKLNIYVCPCNLCTLCVTNVNFYSFSLFLCRYYIFFFEQFHASR